MKRTVVLTLVGIAVVVLAAGVFVRSTWPGHGDNGYRVTVMPRAQPLMAACRSALEGNGVKSGGGALCAAGAGRPWFDIRLRNVSDELGYPVCTVTALDASGRKLFDQQIWLPLDFPSGPSVITGTAIHVVWYLPNPGQDTSYVHWSDWTPAAIAGYHATCHGRPESQVPI